ncbi:MAG: DUF3052 domain-containing protein [Acidobacteriota bacterium]|nr:DUF3052 domain-containing protein [Acidobacteriota bacterium]
MTEGYSGTPLAKKLGIKSGHRLGLIAAPADFERALEGLPKGVRISRRAVGTFDVMVFFSTTAVMLESRFERLRQRLHPDGGLWIAWPKKSSGVATDLDFAHVQRCGLDAGLVDNKVCAIDEIWSGLRFVYRLANRPKRQ